MKGKEPGPRGWRANSAEVGCAAGQVEAMVPIVSGERHADVTV